jgi:biofilm PGA synthesis lipoprotein PgaB
MSMPPIIRWIMGALLLVQSLGLGAADRYALAVGPVPGAPAAPALTVLSYHDVRDDLRDAGNRDRSAISTDHLIAHFDWLYANGYHMVSLQQVLDAMDGGAPLPTKAVLLSFDDGLVSAYTRVYPLLRAYHYPAVLALEGSWLDLPPGQRFDYNGSDCDRSCFLSWEQINQMQASGLVEMASHSYDLHHGVLANPQGNQLPAAVSLRYDAGYEDEASYRQRVHEDLSRSASQIQAHTGRRPRAIVWPYGAYTQVAREEARAAGMPVSFSLDGQMAMQLTPGKTIPRLLVGDNIDVAGLATLMRSGNGDPSPQRIVQVDLDYVYDADPAQQEKNLSALLDRIKRMKPTQVWLQAYADPDGDGVADALYFPNRHLPMRADLFSRVSWQLRTRAGVQVYAWLPVLAFRPPAALQLPTLADVRPNQPGQDHYRLAPWDDRVRAWVGDIYEDLAMHAPMAGLLFSDDAYLRDTDRLGPWAGQSPAQRTASLIGFTQELTARAQRWRVPLKTARNLYAKVVFEPAAEAWFAQSLPAFIRAYDYTGLMTMPQLDQQADRADWYRRLAAAVAAQPGGMQRTVFELATQDWRTQQPISAAQLGARMRLLQAQGARHLGYYPDNFITGQPSLEAIRPYISAADYPYREP